MATKIILKKSSTGGGVPLSSDLDSGEIAVNLVDRKIYTYDGSSVVRIDSAYVSSTTPSNPLEGDLWYDTTNNILKAHNGTSFVAAGYQNLSELEDTTITSAANGEYLKYNGSAWVNSSFETDAEALFSATNTGTGYGDLSYSAGVFTFDRVTDAEIRAAISVTDSGGDGSLSYNSTSGVITYTGPSQAEILAHISGGTGVGIDGSGVISIGQAVATTSDVTFNDMTLTGELKGPSSFTIDPSTHGDDTGTVIIAGNLTVNGTTTTVNSNEVNIGDSIILLNSDETGTPSQNAGLEIERGTSSNVSFYWNETDDAWDLNNETLQNVTLDGGSY